MRNNAVWSFSVLLFLLSIAINTGICQNNPNEEQGLKPHDSFHGGDLDSVSMTSGGLALRIPLVSFPQRGNLDLSFMVTFSNKQWYIAPAKFDRSGKQIAPAQWRPMPNTGVQIVSSTDWWLNTCSMPEFSDPNNPGGQTQYDWSDSVSSPDGSSHLFGDQIGTFSPPLYPMRSADATGLLRPDAQTLIFSNGTRYIFPSGGSCSINGRVRGGLQAKSVTDANGNQITVSASGWTDTLGRFIPGAATTAVQGISPGVATSDLSKCPTGTTSARIWNVPGIATMNGGVRTFYFCYAMFQLSTSFTAAQSNGANNYGPVSTSLLIAVVLPDLTMWTFTYDNYGDVLHVGLPMGGSLAYTYTIGPMDSSSGGAFSTWVTSRTADANNGTGGHQWTYNFQGNFPSGSGTAVYLYSQKGIATVTDPAGNDVVHTIGPGGTGGCPGYEYQTQYFQGPASGGSILKTVQNQFDCTMGTPGGNLDGIALNTVPIQVTTTLPRGTTAKVVNSYDPTVIDGQGQPARIGSLLEQDEYDFSGSLARATATRYLWQDNASYLNSNLVSLISASTVKNAASNQASQATYSYDEVAVLASGVSTGLVAPPAGGNLRGNMTTSSRWLNTTGGTVSSHRAFFDTGMPANSTDPNGNITNYEYSTSYAGAYQTHTSSPDTNGIHHAISGTYDFNTGLLTGFTDQNGKPSSYEYDSMLRLIQSNHPDGGQTTFNYPNATTVERQRKIDSARSDDSFTYFDGLGRTVRTQAQTPSGSVYTDTQYDSLGRVAALSNPYYSSSDPTYGLTRLQYDALGRPTTITRTDSSIITGQFTDNCVVATDEARHVREGCSDAFGRLIEVDEPSVASSGSTYQTLYSYDVLNNVLGVNQKGDGSQAARTRSFSYDSLSRLLTAANPESGQVIYTYDNNGNLRTKKDARGLLISYGYDALNRLISKTFSNGATGPSYTYDNSASYPATNAIGRLVQASNNINAVSTFSYDTMGRVIYQGNGTPSNPSVTANPINASYNLLGALTSLTYPGGRQVIFGYNTGDQLDQVQFAQWQGIGGGFTYWSAPDNSFDPTGTPKSVNLGNSLVETYSLNQRLQLAENTVSLPGVATFADHAYNYSLGADNGNIASVSDKVNSARSQNFTYDALNRLATAAESRWGLSYVYDAWGNRLQQNVTVGSAFSSAITVDSNNHIQGAPAGCTAANAFCYDAAGDLLNDSFHQYSYDIEGRTTAVDNGNASYIYDAVSNRVRKDVSGLPSIEYIYFDGQVVAEHNLSSGNWSDYIYAGNRRIARHDSSLSQVQTQGTCNNPAQGCRSAFWFRGSGITGYRIQAGDKLYITQYVATAGAVAGPGLTYKDANGNITFGDVITNVFDQDGCPMNRDCASFTGNSYHFRRMDLTPLAGMTLADDPMVETAQANANSAWTAYYMDFVLVSADGTVHPFFTGVPNGGALSMTTWNQPGASGLGFNTSSGSNCPTCVFGINYYHTDQLGTSRLLTSGSGWPIWQGTFLPFGEEYNPQTTINHYKFSGKERDSESNLDSFGARSYSSSLGRFTSADWSAVPMPVPYAEFSDPQSLNLYAYVKNNPIARRDFDGHFDDPFGTFNSGDTSYSNMGGGAGIPVMGADGPTYQHGYALRVMESPKDLSSSIEGTSLEEGNLGSSGIESYADDWPKPRNDQQIPGGPNDDPNPYGKKKGSDDNSEEEKPWLKQKGGDLAGTIAVMYGTSMALIPSPPTIVGGLILAGAGPYVISRAVDKHHLTNEDVLKYSGNPLYWFIHVFGQLGKDAGTYPPPDTGCGSICP